jgi:lambda repressor-like predicted transcriptional regulator
MDGKSVSLKRSRGVLLSNTGLHRLEAAKVQAELRTLSQKPFSLVDISHQTGLSYNTLAKVHQRECPVDRKTLNTYFDAFGLTLESDDYIQVIGDASLAKPSLPPETLQGPVPLESPFYVQQSIIKAQWRQKGASNGWGSRELGRVGIWQTGSQSDD